MSFGAGRLEGLENLALEGIYLSFICKPGYVMERVAINASAWHPCVCEICVDLGRLILGHSIRALITSNTSVRFDFEKVHRVC